MNRYDASSILGTSMKRRDFITLLGGSALFAPRIVFAQDASRTRRLGVLSANPRDYTNYCLLR